MRLLDIPTLLGTLGLLLPGCMSHEDMAMHDREAVVPPLIDFGSSSADFDAAPAEDTSATVGEVSFELEAREADVELADGKLVRLWTYNGALPGPTLEARVGDRVRVHLKNSLAVDTTIHWHGLRLPAEMDGVPGARPAIAPGEEFTYEFTATDAGTFWYHPHVSSDEQVERGLYGAIVVRDAGEPSVTSERVVVLDDVWLGEDEQLAPFSSTEAMIGRQGNVLLVNGRANPQLELSPGGLHRFRFVNAATARYFRLSLGETPFHVVGFDNGRLERPRQVEELLLVPGARADVLVESSAEAELTWKTLGYDRGHGTGEAPGGDLFKARLTGEPVEALALPEAFAAIEPVDDVARTRELVLRESMVMAGSHSGHGSSATGPTFSINDKVFPQGEEFSTVIGESEEWAIRNDTEMDHPFHLHGFRFQVVSEQGNAPAFLGYFDSINVPAQQTTTIRIPLEANPGTWMFHCHILEHAERGMMGTLHVAAE